MLNLSSSVESPTQKIGVRNTVTNGTSSNLSLIPTLIESRVKGDMVVWSQTQDLDTVLSGTKVSFGSRGCLGENDGSATASCRSVSWSNI